MNILGLSFYYHDSAAALVSDGTIVAAAEGLLAGKWPSALTAARFAEEGHLRIDRHIPPPRDAWLVLGHAADGDPLGIRGQTERLSLFSSE